MNVPILQKHLLIQEAKQCLESGVSLSPDQVAQLLDFGAFEILQKALRQQKVVREALSLFQTPQSGMPNRKKLLTLYELAQRIRSTSR